MSRTFRVRATLAATFVLVGLVPVTNVRAQSATDSAGQRLEAAEEEIAVLKKRVSQQERSLSDLEKTVRALQAAVRSNGRAVPTNWRNRDGWILLKLGMSRADVVDILGEPRATDAVMDRQTLRYGDADAPFGAVVLIDDRVSEISSDRFKVYAPTDK